MEKRRSCFGLWTAVWILAAVGLLVFFLVAPWAARDLRAFFPNLSGLLWPGLLYVWAVAIPYYAALYRFSRVVRLIAADRSFSSATAAHMRAISGLSIAAGAWFALGFAAVAVWLPRALGAMLLLAFLAMVCFVIALLARALSRLILRAAEIKAENDLTV